MREFFIATVVLMIVSINSINAQEVVVGIRCGISYPTLTGDIRLKGEFSGEAGPILYYSLKKNFYLNTAAMFSVKAFNNNGSILSMYYADIPLYFGYNIAIGRKISCYAQLGPFVGIKLEESKDSGVSKFNAGAAIMFGVNMKSFKVELGYQSGLMNISEHPAESKFKLSSAFLGVNYVF